MYKFIHTNSYNSYIFYTNCIPNSYNSYILYKLYSTNSYNLSIFYTCIVRIRTTSCEGEAQAARAKPEHTSCPDQAAPGCPDVRVHLQTMAADKCQQPTATVRQRRSRRRWRQLLRRLLEGGWEWRCENRAGGGGSGNGGGYNNQQRAAETAAAAIASSGGGGSGYGGDSQQSTKSSENGGGGGDSDCAAVAAGQRRGQTAINNVQRKRRWRR